MIVSHLKVLVVFHILRFEMAGNCVEYVCSHVHGTLVSKLNMVFFQKISVASSLINHWVLLRCFLRHDGLNARLERNFWRIIHRFDSLLEVFDLVWVRQVSCDCLVRTESLRFYLVLPLLNGCDQLVTFKHSTSYIFVFVFKFVSFMLFSPCNPLDAFKTCTLIIDAKKLLVIWLHINTFVRFLKMVRLDRSLLLALCKISRHIVHTWWLFKALVRHQSRIRHRLLLLSRIIITGLDIVAWYKVQELSKSVVILDEHFKHLFPVDIVQVCSAKLDELLRHRSLDSLLLVA